MEELEHCQSSTDACFEGGDMRARWATQAEGGRPRDLSVARREFLYGREGGGGENRRERGRLETGGARSRAIGISLRVGASSLPYAGARGSHPTVHAPRAAKCSQARGLDSTIRPGSPAARLAGRARVDPSAPASISTRARPARIACRRRPRGSSARGPCRLPHRSRRSCVLHARRPRREVRI